MMDSLDHEVKTDVGEALGGKCKVDLGIQGKGCLGDNQKGGYHAGWPRLLMQGPVMLWAKADHHGSFHGSYHVGHLVCSFSG